MAIDSYGHTWHMLDVEIGLPFTLLDAQSLGAYDLRRYNVLIVPPVWGGLGGILEAHGEALASWVEGGGTLIAMGNAAAAVIGAEKKLSSVRLRRNALEDLEKYAFAVERERNAAGEISIDEAQLWGSGDEAPGKAGEKVNAKEAGAEDSDDEDEDEDEKTGDDPDAKRQ